MKRQDGSYCYVATRDATAAGASRRLGLRAAPGADGREIFYAGPAGGREEFVSVVNELGDYDAAVLLGRAAAGDATGDHDSLVSVAGPLGDGFACLADFYAIQTHYWFRDDDTFVCSDDVFAVAAVAGADLSRESLWEYLFFLAPDAGRTWFDGVEKLRPGQGLRYEAAGHRVSVTGAIPVDERLAALPPDSVGGAVRGFCEAAGRAVDGRRAAVSISAGSDSRTVFAIVRAIGAPVHAYSFGAPRLVETREIAELVVKLGVEWSLIDMSSLRSAWIDRFRRTLRATNALLNPYRTHYDEYYRLIPEGEPVFEGVLGSQFLKGEMNVGSIVSPAHRLVVAGGKTVVEAVEREFADLPADFRRGMAEYVADVHAHCLADIHDETGAAAFRRWGLEFFPGRIFAGMILLPLKSRGVYQPLISPSINAAVARLGLGFARDIALRRDHRGPIAVLEAEARIVREIDPEIYRSVLDRGISFREVLELPGPARRLVKKWRNGVKKLRYRNWTWGQVDNTTVDRETAAYARALGGRHPLVDTLLQGDRPKETATLGMILETLERS